MVGFSIVMLVFGGVEGLIRGEVDDWDMVFDILYVNVFIYYTYMVSL